MHRLTARLLLTLLFVGILAPVALAISAPAPHACCMRKPMHDQSLHGSEFRAPASQCQHDCCRATVGFRSAQLKALHLSSITPVSSPLLDPADSARRASLDRSSGSVRAPPQFSNA
jgi:hypothetical protein